MKYIQVNDVHVQDQQYTSRLDDTTETVFTKLSSVYEEAVKQGAHVIITGDLFNQKSPWRVSHKLVLRLAHFFDEYCKEFGVETLILPGTHDLTYGQLESLSKQPLGVLFKASRAKEIKPGLNRFVLDDVPVYIWGAPGVYELDTDEGRDSYVFPKELGIDSPHRITVSHGMLLRPGETFFGSFTQMDWVAERTDARIHMNGHPHWEQGFTEIGDVVFSNPGSLLRSAMTDDARSRAIKCSLFEISLDGTLTYEYLPVEHQPASVVFSLDLVDEKQNDSLLKEFEASVHDSIGSIVAFASVDDILKAVSGAKVPSGVFEIIRAYLERAEEAL